MPTPFSQIDAKVGLTPQGGPGRRLSSAVSSGVAAVAPVMPSRLGRLVWLLFVSGCLVPLLLFMVFQYRRLAEARVASLGTAMIQAAHSVQADVEYHIATRFDFLEHMILHLDVISDLSGGDHAREGGQGALIYEAGALGFETFLVVDRSGTIIRSWPDDGRVGQILPIGDPDPPSWVVFLEKTLDTGQRFCAPPETGDARVTERLAHLSAPIRDEAGRIIGAAVGLLRPEPLLASLRHAAEGLPHASLTLRCQDFSLSLGPSPIRADDPDRPGNTRIIGRGSWPEPIVTYRDGAGHPYAGLEIRLDPGLFRGAVWQLAVNTDLSFIGILQRDDLWFAGKFLLGALVLIGFLTYVITHETVSALRHYLGWAVDAARGRAVAMERPHGHHEVAELGKALSDLSFRLRETLDLCSSLSAGNPGKPLRVLDENDRLGLALNGVRDYFNKLMDALDRITGGQFVTTDPAAAPTDLMGRKLQALSDSLSRMNEGNMRLLSATYAQMELARQMGAEQNFSALITGILSFVCRQVKATTGALYLADTDSTAFVLKGTHGAMDDDYPEKIAPGERLSGQAVRSMKPLLAPPAPVPAVGIEGGLFRGRAVSVLAFPFVLRNEVIAVMELAGLYEFKSDHVEFIKKNNESIAIALHSAQARNLTETLLRKTVDQAESLKRQQEQLSTANRDLAAQADALKQSETRLMAREKELEEANRELAAHTRRLEEQKRFLDQKNRELEDTKSILETKAEELTRSNRYKSEFLANMSHELRTPLNSIILLSRTLGDKLEKEPGSPLVKFADIINAAGRDLLNLIDDVLDLTKLSSGDMARNMIPYELRDVERVLKYWFGKVALEKNIDFDMVWTEPLPTIVYTDPTKLEKILKSLLSNAFKYTSRGRVSVTIRRPDPDRPLPVKTLNRERTVEFLITDTGEGIPEAMQSAIFDAFKQGDGSITRKHGGTGLGLSLAQEFARLLRGDIQLVHSDERGSAFRLLIPDGEPTGGEA
ncbi:hypothetical protein JCM14469_22970 [Desulfatiferula olefinivorans]